MRRALKWVGLLSAFFLIVTFAPILWIETSCKGSQSPQAEAKYILDEADHRPEARTILTYPEWHIVYAYEGYAETLKSGPPHHFPYFRSITQFWGTLCALKTQADAFGPAGFESTSTIYTIGASFTWEMLFKALYEETLGRVTSYFGDSAQDRIERDMAAEYAAFLQQTPWYKFDFIAWADRLSDQPRSSSRAWERHIALNLEWRAKSAYAGLIAQAVEGVGEDKTTMHIAHNGAAELGKEITVLDEAQVSEVDRYRVFTRALMQRTDTEFEIFEIAGNDDILLSILGTQYQPPPHATVIYETTRIGFEERRYLVLTKVPDLMNTIRGLDGQTARLEHVYDY